MEPTVTGYDILFVFVITGILGSWGWRVTQGRLNLIRLIATGVGVAVGFVFGMMLAVIFLAVFEFNTTVRYVMLIGSAVLMAARQGDSRKGVCRFPWTPGLPPLSSPPPHVWKHGRW